MKQIVFILFLLPIIGFAQNSNRSVSVDVNEDDGKREIKIVTKINGEKKVYEWTDSGEIPEDIRRQLEEADIDISSLDGERVQVIVDGDDDMNERKVIVISDGDEEVNEWTSDDGKHIRIQTDGPERIVNKEVIVIKKVGDDGEVIDLDWDGEGEMPDEMKQLIEEHDIDIDDEDVVIKKRIQMHKDKSKRARHYAMEDGRKKNKKHKKHLKEHENVFVFSDDVNDLSDAYMGVHIESSDSEGARIIEILKDSPADKAGLQKEDLVTRVNDARIKDMESLLDLLNYFEPEDEIELVVVRNGSESIIKVKLGKRPESFR